MSGPELRQVRGACGHDYPDTCSWVVDVNGDRADSLRGDPDHPFTRGTLCAKVELSLANIPTVYE